MKKPVRLFAAILVCVFTSGTAAAEVPHYPVLVPITGFLSLEGTAQRNGAVLALAADKSVTYEVLDTATSPEVAVNAMERALRDRMHLAAIIGPILGTQMLAMLPLAAEYEVPLVTISGTARLTELDNRWIFRFFPGDAVTKVAHARYVVEELGARRPAILYQTTAYGQSGRRHLAETFRSLGAEPVYQEGLDVSVKDMAPALSKALAAQPDVLVLHLHSGSTARIVRQARARGVTLPIVAACAPKAVPRRSPAARRKCRRSPPGTGPNSAASRTPSRWPSTTRPACCWPPATTARPAARRCATGWPPMSSRGWP
jgi:branched-chain amino acid transport system substrate-binding protein